MRINTEKGITNIDITISIIVITLFIALIASIMYTIRTNSSSMERRAEAINYAINEIESLKAEDFESLQDMEEANAFQHIISGNQTTGYSKKITVTDYADLPENQDDQTILSGLVKKVTVQVAYKEGETTQTVELSTAIAKK